MAVLALGGYQNIKQFKFIENCAGKSFYQHLILMIDSGKICEAEKEMLHNIKPGEICDLELFLAIYTYINEKDDDFLEQNNYSREKIEEGIQKITEKFGYFGII